MTDQPAAANTPTISTVLLLAITIISPITLNIYPPVMPALTIYYGSDISTIQLSFTLYFMFLAVGQLIYGPLSDRFGRLPLLRIGMVTYLLGTLSILVTNDLAGLIAGRIGQALGATAGMVMARAMVRDLYGLQDSARILSYLSMGIAVGPIIAPVLSGVVTSYLNWIAVFYGLLVSSLIFCYLAFFSFFETNQKPIPSISLSDLFDNYRSLIIDRNFLSYSLISMFLSAGFFIFISGASYILINNLGYSAGNYGMYLMMIALVYFAGAYISSRFSVRLSPQKIIKNAFGFITAALMLWLLLILTIGPQLITLFAPMLLYALGRGISEPNIIAICINVKPKLAGTAAGLLGAIQLAGSGLMTMLVPKALNFGMTGLVYLLTITSSGAIISYLLVSHSKA
ncbi:MAG: multidrug effflux MFS transporter [Pseudomonadales bacterium]|nr:multidrug effflux MFS transporter [Pseudomonadales bacterium]